MRSLALFGCLLIACASTEKKEGETPADKKAEGPTNTPAPAQVDRGRCDASGKKVQELDVSGDRKPDVWKFYASVIENNARIDVLTCKEVDLNYDGRKDVWVYYDNSGNVQLEEFDLDFDGKIDLWSYYSQGKRARQELDANFDGRPDIWKFFENDKLARIERSSKKNGRIDVWEYYEGGRLDRIGYDSTGAGTVDRWDRAPEEQSAQQGAAPSPGPATPAESAPTK